MQDTEYTYEERIAYALQWLGYEGVEIGKRFSSDKFVKDYEKSLETEIIFENKDNLIPRTISQNVIKLMENILDFHEKLNEERALAEKQKEQVNN